MALELLLEKSRKELIGLYRLLMIKDYYSNIKNDFSDHLQGDNSFLCHNL